MDAKLTWQRITAAVVVIIVAVSGLGAAGVWGVVLAAPVLVLAPSAVRDGLREAKAKRRFRAELARIPGWKKHG